MSCWPRSGGTLLNKILANSIDVIILSEINLKYKSNDEKFSIRWQLNNWYGIKTPRHMSNIEILKFVLESDKRKIILRSFDFVDFVPTIFNKLHPNNKNNNEIILNKYFKVRHFAFVRPAFDVYKSMATSSHKLQDINFFYYAKYVKELIRNRVKIFYYDDLCEKPEDTTKTIFKYLGLDFRKSVLKKLRNDNVFGDTKNSNGSRGWNNNKIIKFGNKAINKKIKHKLINHMKNIDTSLNLYKKSNRH